MQRAHLRSRSTGGRGELEGHTGTWTTARCRWRGSGRRRTRLLSLARVAEGCLHGSGRSSVDVPFSLMLARELGVMRLDVGVSWFQDGAGSACLSLDTL